MTEEKKPKVRMRMTFRNGGLVIEFDPLHLVWLSIEEV